MVSLLLFDADETLARWSQEVFQRQFASDPRLQSEYDSRRQRRMMEDITYNLNCLQTAVAFAADDIFTDYAVWIYELLVHRMPDLTRERIRDQMNAHYRLLADVLAADLSPAVVKPYHHHLQNAIAATNAAAARLSFADSEAPSPYAAVKDAYIQHLLASRRQEAGRLILDQIDAGVPLVDVYIEIFGPAMREVGTLWHQGKITVDKEHYCTAVTQTVMAQLYPKIFGTQRVNRTILACCVGRELHEMGIRMLCDIFEVHGWDSVYLGAAVPAEGILASIREYQPDVVALSVTMPHHLQDCETIVNAIQHDSATAGIKTAVGGRAVQLAPHVLDRWPVDTTATDALQLVQWAQEAV